MSTFDAPNRDTCVVRRARTNTPLQALVTMNDPVYVEAAQALAKRTMNLEGSLEDRVTFLFRRCLVRPPTSAEVARLVKLYKDAHARFRKDAGKANQFAGPLTAMVDPASHAAMTLVASVVMNLDEMLMKR
jgi:hypothetical protein